MGDNIKLTKKELDIMNTLWNTRSPLTVTEICSEAKKNGLNLNQSTVAVTIKKLVRHNFIEVSDLKQTSTNYARAFKPIITSEEYALNITKNTFLALDKNKRATFITSLLNDESYNDNDLDYIISLIEELKN